MIRKIEIQNFRGQTKTVHLDRINIIAGKNGSGKSTIAHAIDFAIFGHYRGSDLAQTADAVRSRQRSPHGADRGADPGQTRAYPHPQPSAALLASSPTKCHKFHPGPLQKMCIEAFFLQHIDLV